MAIPEAQLDIWTALGSVPQSSATYESIKNVLHAQSSPYYKKIGASGFETFLQGSYRNHTNVFGDSDVDIVILQTSSFYYNLDALSPQEQAEFKRLHPTPALIPSLNSRRTFLRGSLSNTRATSILPAQRRSTSKSGTTDAMRMS